MTDDPVSPVPSAHSSKGYLSLRWNGFHNHVVQTLVSLFRTQELTDVTLVSDNGEPIKAHKIILALSSPYFRKILKENPCKHPIIILKGMKYHDVQQVMNFIYLGEIRVHETEFEDFIETAESLRIDGINPNSTNLSSDSDSSQQSPNIKDECMEDSQSQNNNNNLIPESQSPNQLLFQGPLLLQDIFNKASSVSSGISSATSSLTTERHPTPISSPQHYYSQQSKLSSGGGTGGTDDPPLPPPPLLIEINDTPINHGQAGSRHRNSSESHSRVVDIRQTDSPIQDAEDLSKSSQDTNSSCKEAPYDIPINEPLSYRSGGPELIITTTPPFISYRHEKRSTSWPLDAPPHFQESNSPTSIFPPKTTLPHPLLSHRFHPFLSTGNIPRPIPQHPLSFQRFRPIPTSTVTSSEFNERAHHRRHFNHNLHRIPQFKYSIMNHHPTNSSGNSNFTKPKTKAIRSSQVPQSSRYTATQVDAMVEKVENFPGPLVPCIVCQKFVKRERLRAHIHECHLLPEEKIECPICKIGLKSKGSYRVHLWRHRRSKSASVEVKIKDDRNLPPKPPPSSSSSSA